MADTHTATEERDCLQAFSNDGLSWAQIQAEAKRQPVTIETKEVDDEEEVTVDDVRPRTQTKTSWSDERYREEVLRDQDAVRRRCDGMLATPQPAKG
jgi:hypothetical protein